MKKGPVQKIKNPFSGDQTYSEFGSPEEMEEKLSDLWKVFGRETPEGRELYKLYGAGHKKKVNLPKPKTQPWDPKTAHLKPKKPCPQQAKVYYPPVMTKQKLESKARGKVAKVDLIPKRKNREDILLELEEMSRNIYVPVNKGKDRVGMINNLQDAFRYAADNEYQKKHKITADEALKIKRATEARMRLEAKKNYFYQPEPRQQEDRPDFSAGVDPSINNPKLRELTGIFDAVVEEIEERQQYLAEIEHLDMKEAKERVKSEIVGRVAELQNINKMIKEERSKNGK